LDQGRESGLAQRRSGLIIKGAWSDMNVELSLAYDAPREVELLFSEYTQLLVEGDRSFQDYLAVQNYEGELGHLREKYGLPDGRLYLARCDGQPAGCIGLRKLSRENCEMKRLYVRPRFRGQHIGNLLVERVIADAGAIGYAHMLLDTLPFLQGALRLYRRHGFYEIPKYNNSPMSASIYMRLDL